MNYFQRRKLLKSAKETQRHARHVRHMREDVMDKADLQRFCDAEDALAKALKAGDVTDIGAKQDELYRAVLDATPKRSSPTLRENLEVFAVAIAVAMAFRAYFLQPFKIPTGSMEPTLYGIKTETDAVPTFMDRFPLKLIKWAATGEWYTEVRAKADGYVSHDLPYSHPNDTSHVSIFIGGKAHKIPARGHIYVRPGEVVSKGAILWSGIRTAGDHVLVDKVRWNLRLPRLGEVMVFKTDGIPALQQGTHYIKRMSGLPGNRVSIHPPNLLINGQIVTEPEAVRRISGAQNGYSGYTLINPGNSPDDPCPLSSPDSELALGPGEYLALGDNTRNSRDSRYWGPVPQSNLVGPAMAVYWPFSRRWGLIH